MPYIPGLENLNMSPIIAETIYWLGMVLLGIIILVAFAFVYYMIGFPIKATVFPLYGSGKDGVFSIGKKKSNRVKWIEKRTAWKKLFPLFNKEKLEPFDAEYMYPGKQIYVYELNDIWIPGRVNIEQSEQELRCQINPVPYYVRNWQSLQHKQNAIEFAKQDFWTENKQFFIVLGVTLFCCALCGAVVYFTYKYASGGREEVRMLTEAIRGFGSIAGQKVPV